MIFLGFSAYKQQSQIDTLEYNSQNQVKYALALIMKNIEGIANITAQSGEFLSFLHSPENLRGFTTNLLNAKVSDLSNEFSVVSNWIIFDASDHQIFSFSDEKQLNISNPKINGFTFNPNSEWIIYRKTLKFDDQYLSGPAAQVRGYLVLLLSKSRLINAVPNLNKIISLPASPNISKVIIDIKRTIDRDHELLPLFLGVSILLFLCIGFGLSMMRARVLDPIINLTKYVGSKANLKIKKSSISEVDQLKNTFDAYIDHINETHQSLLKKSKDEALASQARQVAHDIRSPLTALKMLSDNLKSIGEDQRLLLRSAVDRINKIANHLTEKENSNRNNYFDEKTSIVSIPALIDSVVNEKRLQYQNNSNVEIINNIDSSSYRLFSQINQIEMARILSNLINNSIEATNNNGKVEINLFSVLNNCFTISVKDNGCGIPKNLINKVTEKGATFNKKDGTGLGLFHASNFVEQWGGKIKIHSIVGMGTEVQIILSCCQIPIWLQLELLIQPSNIIVILDDDKSIHNIWKSRLKKHINLKNFLNFFTIKEIDQWLVNYKSDQKKYIYLLDYELMGEKETGLDVAERISDRDNIILVTSAYEDPILQKRCLELGIRIIPKCLAPIIPLRAPTNIDKPFHIDVN